MNEEVRDPALQALKSPDPSIRMMAATALVNAPEDDDAVDDALLAAVGDVDRRVRRAASEALVGRDPMPDHRPLLEAIREAEGSLLRPDEPLTAGEVVEYGLGRLKSVDVTAVLLQSMMDDDPAVRAATAPVLAQTRDPRALTPLRSALVDPFPSVRASAAHALIRFGDSGRADLLELLARDPDPAVRAAAAIALGTVNGEGTRDALRAARSDAAREVQKAAARALREQRMRRLHGLSSRLRRHPV